MTHCDPMCPFLGCASCAYSGGETPADATESAPVSGVACETIEAAPGGASTPLVQGPRPSDMTGGLPSMMPHPDPLPCGHRTKHGQRIGCCAGCRHLFSSDTAFNAHRRVGQCLDPRTVGLVGRPSRTAPGEVIWAFPASDVPWGER